MAGNSKSTHKKTFRRKLLMEKNNKQDKNQIVPSQGTAGTSKTPDVAFSTMKVYVKKLLIENKPNQDDNQNIIIQDYQATHSNVPRRQTDHLSIPRNINSGPYSEQPEPEIATKEEFISSLGLLPHKVEPTKLGYKIDGKRKLYQSFSVVPLTSQRGQALLAINDQFNIKESLERNSKYCGTHDDQEEEEDMIHMRTRSSNPIHFFKKENIIRTKYNTFVKSSRYVHMYKWPSRTRNVVYPQKMPSVKECCIKLTKLSEELINFWNLKKSSKGTTTPSEWKGKELAICPCRKIPIIILDDELNVKTKNKSSSTHCNCDKSNIKLKPKNSQKFENKACHGMEMISPEVNVLTHHKNMSKTHACKNITFSTTCDTAQQMTLTYLDEKGSFDDYSVIPSETFASSKRVLRRRPLAVVPPEPITVNEEIADTANLMYHPDESLSVPLIKPFRVCRSLTSHKWYSKEDSKDVSVSCREALVKDRIVFGVDRSQENIKPFNDMILPEKSVTKHGDCNYLK